MPSNRKAFIAIENIEKTTKFGIEKGFFDLGNDLNNELSKQMLARNKKGRVYTRRIKGGSRRRHQASAAGQTAANRSGKLRKSRDFKVRGDEMEWGMKAEHAEFLEDGTSKMAPRPSGQNTVKATQRNAQT